MFNVPLSDDQRALLGANLEMVNGEKRKLSKSTVTRGDLVQKLVEKFNENPTETLKFLGL